MADKKMKVILGADISEFTKAMDTVKSSTKDTTGSVKKGFDSIEGGGGKIKSAFGTVGKVIATAFAVDKVIGFGKSVVENAASAQAMEAQFSQVFGSMDGKATQMIDSMGSEFNMLPNRVKPVFTSLSSMFLGVGMDSESAMKVAQNATMASADAAAFYDTSMESASSSVRSFIKGNYEAGESVGIFANDTQMAQFAIQSGVVSTAAEWRDLDEATKMATRTEYVRNMQEQSGAMGQASREGSGYENVMGNLSQAWKDFQASLGVNLLPAVVGVVESLTEGLQNVDVDAILAGFSAFGGYLKDVFTPVFEATKEVVSEVWEAFKDVGGIEMAQESLERVKEALNFVRDNAEQLTPILAGLLGGFLAFQTITTVVGIINSIKTAITGLKTATSLANAIQIIFNGTLLANPFTWVAIAIGVLIGAIVAIWKNWDSISKFLTKSWASIKDVAKSVFEGISQFLTDSWNSIQDVAKSVFGAIGQFFSDVWEKIKSVFSTSVEFISNIITVGFLLVKSIIEGVLLVIQAIFQTYWNIYKAIIETVFNIIKSIIENVLNIIKTIISAIWEQIGGVVTTVLTAIQTVISTVWNAIKDVITIVVTAIQAVISTIWNAIKDTVSTVVNAIKDVVTNVWNAIQNTMTTILNAVKDVVTTVWNAISSVTSTVFNAIMIIASSVWNGIKTLVTTVVNALKTAVQTAWNAISSVTSSVFNAVKSVVTSVWNGIKSAITSVVNGVKTTVSNVWNSIKSTTSSVFNGIKSTATSVWNGVKSAITTPIESAKNKVKGIIDAIKGFFSGMRLSIPKISMPPLPHFNISGGFSLNPPSVPKLSLSWYETGGIATGPSVVGIGENGDEAILPLSNKSRMAPFASAVASLLDRDSSGGNEESRSWEHIELSIPVILNGKEVAKAVVEDLDTALYGQRRRTAKARGRL